MDIIFYSKKYTFSVLKAAKNHAAYLKILFQSLDSISLIKVPIKFDKNRHICNLKEVELILT